MGNRKIKHYFVELGRSEPASNGSFYFPLSVALTERWLVVTDIRETGCSYNVVRGSQVMHIPVLPYLTVSEPAGLFAYAVELTSFVLSPNIADAASELLIVMDKVADLVPGVDGAADKFRVRVGFALKVA